MDTIVVDDLNPIWISSDEEVSPRNNNADRELIFCLGMSWSHPTDRVRLLSLQNRTNIVVSVSRQTNVPGDHIDCDFKTDRGTKSILRYLHAAMDPSS